MVRTELIWAVIWIYLLVNGLVGVIAVQCSPVGFGVVNQRSVSLILMCRTNMHILSCFVNLTSLLFTVNL